MKAEQALEIIVDLLEKAGPWPNPIQRAIGSRVLLDDIETIAISYDEMDYEVERYKKRLKKVKKLRQKHHLSSLFTRVYNLNKNKDLELDK